MKKLAKIFGLLAATLLLFFSVALLAFYHLAQVGEFRRFLISEFEGRTGLKVEVGEAEVQMGRVVGVSFRKFVLIDPESGRPLIAAPRMLVRVALLPLLERQLSFYELRLYEPNLHIVRDEQGNAPLIDLILNLPFQDQQAPQFSLDLREIRIEKGDVTFTDNYGGKGPVLTRFREIDLYLRRVRARGLLGLGFRAKPNPATRSKSQPRLDFRLKTIVDRDGQRAGLGISGKVLFAEGSFDLRKAWLDADLQAEALPAALLWDYYDRPLAESAVRGALAYRVHWEGRLAEGAHLKGEVRFSGLEIEAQSIFPSVVRLGDGRLEMALDWKPREIHFQRLDLRSKDLTLAVRGSLRSLDGQDPYVELRLSTPFLPLAAVRSYFPTKIFQSPRLEYLAATVNQGEVRLAKAALSGKLSQLRRPFEPGHEEHLSLDAEVREAGGSFGGDHALALRGFSGRIVLEKGILYYKDFKGAVGLSRLVEIQGTHRGVLSSSGLLELRIKGDMEVGQLREQMQLGFLPLPADRMAGALQDLAGRGRLDLLLRTDFSALRHYEGTLSLDGARLRVGDVSLSQLKGELLFSPAEIRADRATALLAGSPVQIRLLLRNFGADQGTFDLGIDSSGFKASEALRLLLSLGPSQSPGTVQGAIRYQGSLTAAENRKLSGSLELVGVQLPFRFLRQPLREVNGRVRLDGHTIDFQGVKGQVGGYGFSLNGRWVGGEKPMLMFSLGAAEMDIAYLLPHEVSRDEAWYERLQVRGKLSLDKGRYESFSFSDLKTDLTLEKRLWRLENFFARSEGGTVEGGGAFADTQENGRFSVEPNVRGVALKGLLSWFDMGTTEVTGKVQLAGKFDFRGKTGAERKRDLNGAFHLRVEDGVARRFQLLVRVLSFLDLSRWFTLKMPNVNQEGIHFRSVTADFKVSQGVYSTQNLFVDSDDLRITGAGELDGPKGNLDFVIAVRPFPGVDSAANYIPILGTGLAAIKNSLLVASFNVRGPVDDPSITPAPFSTLSEFFYGALAIPKGLIGLPSGENK